MFDQDQVAAVEASEHTIACIAGPGSGKTRVLLARIERLLGERVAGESILAVTFTRRAAGEMRERLIDAVGPAAASEVRIDTLHAIGYELLLRYGYAIGIDPFVGDQVMLNVYSGWQTELVADIIAERCGLTFTDRRGKRHRKVPAAAIYDAILAYDLTGRIPPAGPLRTFMIALHSALRENAALTYGMLIAEAVRALEVGNRWFPWRHILVDEAQDLDPMQWKLLRILGEDASMFCVGDPMQAIYGWRGADPAEFARFCEEAQKTVILRHNYRSGTVLVAATDRLCPQGPQDAPGSIRVSAARKEAPGSIRVVTGPISGAAAAVSEAIEGGRSPREVAVLCRTNWMAAEMRDLLTFRGIQTEGVSWSLVDEGWADVWPAADCFLASVHNPHDAMSRQCAVSVLAMPASCRPIPGGGELLPLVEWIRENMSAPHGLEDDLQGKMADLERFALTVGDDLAQYIRFLATRDVSAQLERADGEAVSVLTVHGGKGLEWPVVVVAGFNEGLMPRTSGDQDEERRIAYVALTRAGEELVLYVDTGEGEFAGPRAASSFLAEMRIQ